MKPMIFMDDFERTEFSDAYFSAIGRALTIASRFEGLARVVALQLGAKKYMYQLIMESEASFQDFTAAIVNSTLGKQLKSIGLKDQTLRSELGSARVARNVIAHELSAGLDCCLDSLPADRLQQLISEIRRLTIDLARGDLILSYLASRIAGEETPNAAFLDKYPGLIASWVCDL